MTVPCSDSMAARCLCVGAIISTNEAGGAIFSGRDETGELVRVVARHKVLPRIPAMGETWTVEGAISSHSEYGRQLHATRCTFHLPQGRLLTQYLARHPDFKGIGETKALRLYETFGDELLQLLNDGNSDALSIVLSPTMAQYLVTIWADKRIEGELIAHLDQHGFDIRLATKIRRAWGDRALEMLTRNPYFMLAFTGWKTVDAAASRLGIARDDERRLIGAVEACLYDRLSATHTLTPHSTLIESLRKRLRIADPIRAVELAIADRAVIGTSATGYQPLGAAALEDGIAERLKAMLAGETPLQLSILEKSSVLNEDAAIEWIQNQIFENERCQGITFNAEQRDAVVMAVTQRFSLLTGGAGVGKTTVLRACIGIAGLLGLGVYQMALAGRAAKRMREATGYDAMTIARFLAAVNADKLKMSAHSLIVVDEASMLDLPTMYRLLRCIPEGARLLLVGDSAQLPPIGFGLVFHKLVQSDAVPCTRLLQVHRQAESTGIPSVANAIRHHRIPELRPFNGELPGASFIDCAPGEVVGRLFDVTKGWVGGEWQILSAIKDGPAGINCINGSFHMLLRGSTAVPGWHLAVGDPVVHLVNDYERDVMNGTLGRIVNVVDGTGIVIEFEGHEHAFGVSEIVGRIELAYAISVHKSQGSQFKRVAVVVEKCKILDHALLYTALTRGTEQVVFVGDRAEFERAVLSAPSATNRLVAFAV